MTIKQIRTLPCPAAGLIPHEDPMLLVNTVLQIADDNDPESYSLTDAITPQNGVFLYNKKVSIEYLIELMAQSIAAVDGFKSHPDKDEQKKPSKGFLAGIDDFTLNNTPTPGTKLLVKLKKTLSFGSIFIFEGSIYELDEILATGVLKIWKEDK